MTRWDYFPMALGPCAPAPDVQGGWQITSYFGGRVDPITGIPGSHGGQDLAYAGCRNAPIYAPSAGTMSQAWDATGGGNWTGITLDDGSYIGIGHASSFAPGNPYRRVAAGELVAYCDSTGGSTGDHVHIAYRPAGSAYYADPYDLLEDSQHRPVGGGGYQPEDDMPSIEELRKEFTGQTSQPSHKVLSQWEADSRQYQSLVIHDLRTGRWWVLFGPFKWETNEGYGGWWDQNPTVLFAGHVQGSCWQTACVDNALEVKVGADGRLVVATGPRTPVEPRPPQE